MSDTNSPAPRRSQRDRKAVKPFISVASSSHRKRKRNSSETGDDAPEQADAQPPQLEQSDEENDESEADEGYEATKTKGGKGKRKSSPKPKATPTAKKPRAEKPLVSKPLKVPARRGRKPKADNAYDADQVAKDTNIHADNPLFNAIMNPASPLQSSAEDFLESLQQSPEAALAELINLVLRACGCNDSVNADQVVDFDGIVSALDDFTEVLKQENSPVYPLTSKLAIFKRFRKSLSEWIERLIISAADLGSLYSTQLMETLQQWVVSMSSSQIRSFRHTATVIALEAETALCDVAAAVDKEAEIVARQREGEKKRKASAKGLNSSLKEIERKGQAIKRQQTKLKSYIKEFVDGVFVHRFRDLDPNIRAECVRAIGLWLKKYPDYFLDAHYLRYVGWVLSDENNHVRLEAVKALSNVYDQTESIPSLTHFTERFKSRLLEMATSDVELSIRVAVIHVLGDIESNFPLEEEEKDKLCLLLFDEEGRVRRAVSPFVRAVWEEETEELLNAQNKPSDKDIERLGFKVLAKLFVRWGRALDSIAGDAEESELGDVTLAEDDSMPAGASRRTNRRQEVIALVTEKKLGRIALAVEALWSDIESLGRWEELLELLLLDHSASGDNGQDATTSSRARANGKKKVDDFQVADTWRLEEVEEAVLLEVLVTALRLAKEESANGKKGEEENVSNNITRELIKGLPRLFIKHQSDQGRIAEVLVIPTLMNLDLYLEMRMISAYTALWDDVIKQFMSHSSAKVLSHSMAAIRYFMEATSLSNSNSTKILELEDELSTQLRDIIAGRDEIEVAAFSEDEVLALNAWCTRLGILAGTRNMTAWIEEDEGGKQSSAWDILNALVERGRLGYKEEETMIGHALHALTLHILWKTKGLTAVEEPTPEDIRYKEVLQQQRESLLEKLVEYAVGTQSNTVDGVKRAAFKHLLDLHVLYAPHNAVSSDSSPLPTASLALTLDDEVQYRCAGYMQAEIERYAEFLDDEEENGNSDDSDAAGQSDDQNAMDTDKPTKAKKPKPNKRSQQAETNPRDLLEREYLFIDVVSTFLRAIRCGVIHVHHGATILAHYGRLEAAFDACSRVVVDGLREESIMKENPQISVATITRALEESYTLVLDGLVRDETNATQLAKLLANCFVVRGTQLSVIRRLPSQYIIQIQTNLLSWISKRLAGYNASENKRSFKVAIAFFKVLIPLLNAIDSRDALKVKAHMDQVLSEAKVEVSATSKIWEPQRAYEKRLSAIMSKDNPTVLKAKRGRKKGAAPGASSGEESEGERTLDEAQEPLPQPRPRPRRSARNNPDTAGESTGDEHELVTPKARRGRPVRKRSPSAQAEPEPQAPDDGTGSRSGSPLPSLTPSEDGRVEPEEIHVEPDETQVEHEEAQAEPDEARSSLKRPRSDEEEENDRAEVNGADVNLQDEMSDIPDIQIRRKRIRH